jgi:gliding motility-associated-like protein
MVFSSKLFAFHSASQCKRQRMHECVVQTATTLMLLLGLAQSHQALATHNRAGEITYTHVSGLTYEILITTYTKSTAPADRPFLYLYWGDENGAPVDSLERESETLLEDEVQMNLYRGLHTYGGPGVYEIQVEDPNRNNGVLNIPGSVDVPFSISSLLIIDPQAGHNSSVQLLNPAQQNACLFQTWIHNPGAHDPDGDLLTYDLVPCRGFNTEIIPDYFPPDEVSPGDDSFTIDPVYGDVIWDAPEIPGIYNVAMRIQEWRDVGGALVLVGEVVRDMQITVEMCTNQPPVLDPIVDTCVVAGSFLSLFANATDPDGDNVVLDAIGGPLTEVTNLANFTNLGAGIGQFIWSPECTEVRETPYQVIVRAEDNSNQVQLMDLESFQIKVIAPGVEMGGATPVGNSVILDWNSNPCLSELPPWKIEAGNYHIYRKLDSLEWSPELCETGVPAYTGYEWVHSVEGLDVTEWIDTSTLSFGATYCYRVVTSWPGSGESLSSDEVCATIRKDVPVMTMASVAETSEEGAVNLAWSPPTDADTLVFPGPYSYRIFGAVMGEEESEELLFETNPSLLLVNPDTLWTHAPINTMAADWNYRVSCFSGADQIGISSGASTPWLRIESDDNRLTLNVTNTVPWTNGFFEFYREDALGVFTLIGTASEPAFTDSGLVNNETYCYRVRTIGAYEGPGVPYDLINWSQEVCAVPFDFTPPCPPEFRLDSDCIAERNTMEWQDAFACADDVMAYQLHWAPFLGESLMPIEFFDGPDFSEYVWNEAGEYGSIAGCFALSALDSLMPGPDGTLRRNESALSDTICVDNCPYYFLPNVFTPNRDNVNDLFQAFPWKFIDSVDVRIFNRNGEEVFQTLDPSINWSGIHRDGGMCADGVYYVTAKVFTIRLTGIVEENFSGELQLLNGVLPPNE